MGSRAYGVAICGLGRAGQIHLGNCYRNPNVNIKYLVEIDLEKAKMVKDEYFLTDTTVLLDKHFDTVLEDPSVDGVIIATVTKTHEVYVRKCIDAKKAIFCEKPIAGNLKDTIACYEAAEKAKVPIFCAFNRRFDSTHSAVKLAVDKGEIGKVHMVKLCSRDSPPPPDAYLKISGGIFHDSAVHDIDMAMWILKECPISVFTHGHAIRKIVADVDDVDIVSLTMKFPSGAIAQIDMSRFSPYGYDQRVEVFGELGMLESENQYKTSVRISTGVSVAKQLCKYSFPQRYHDAYASEIQHFVDVMRGGMPLTSKTDVVLVSLVASACEASRRCGKPMRINKDNFTFEPAC